MIQRHIHGILYISWYKRQKLKMATTVARESAVAFALPVVAVGISAIGDIQNIALV